MKTILITGAASGIGRATMKLAHDAGYWVEGLDIGFDYVPDSPSPDRWCDVSMWPTMPHADVVVACAGVRATPTPFENMTQGEWNRVMSVNLDGVAATCQQAGKNMIAHGGGSIVIVGSISGIVANKGFHNAVYNASKAACHQLARSLAVEWARFGIRVNVVAPGPIKTSMSDGLKNANPDLYSEFGNRTVLGRWGRPEEVAEAILFLAEATFITGSVLTIDGGYTAW